MHTIRRIGLIVIIIGTALAAADDSTSQSSMNPGWFLQSIRTPKNLIPNRTAKIVVAVVDDAVRITHQDLTKFIWTNPDEIPRNNIDDDGNGYVDDTHGWDVADNDSTVTPPPDRLKDFYHGTHLAGIVAQIAQSAYGNISPDLIRIMPVKCLADKADKTYLKDGYKGIEYAVKAGADIIICAWGVGHISPDESKLLQQAHDKGILIVASAGNFPEGREQYPAAHESVLAVAALNSGDKKIEKSNYGAFIDISAPGINISSAGVHSDTAHETRQGSSFATAIVAGAAAIIELQHPSHSPQEIKACLKSSAQPIDAINPQYTAKLGAGKLNIEAAVKGTLFQRHAEQANQLLNPQGYLRLYSPAGKPASWTIKPHGTFKGLRFKPLLIKGLPGRSVINFYSDHSPDAKLLKSTPLADFPDSIYIAGTSAYVTYEPKDTDCRFECLLEYEAEPIDFSTLYCRGTQHLDVEGTFEDGSGPDNYSPNCDCKWLITAPPGKVIHLKFTEFDTEAKTDLLYFFNGSGTHEKIMAVFSGPNIPPKLTTWRNQVLVWFVTDGKNQGAGWKAQYRFENP